MSSVSISMARVSVPGTPSAIGGGPEGSTDMPQGECGVALMPV
jgi:hypothetical protein